VHVFPNITRLCVFHSLPGGRRPHFTFCTTPGSAIKKYLRLARQIFSAQRWRGQSLSARTRRLTWWRLSDSRRDNSVLEACLKETFGTYRHLFDVLPTSGSKIGVMTISVSDTKLCVFSNYNGEGKCRIKSGPWCSRGCKSCLLTFYSLLAPSFRVIHRQSFYLGSVSFGDLWSLLC
jgi:hypothetical protein